MTELQGRHQDSRREASTGERGRAGVREALANYFDQIYQNDKQAALGVSLVSQ
jgi:hypothetical protein